MPSVKCSERIWHVASPHVLGFISYFSKYVTLTVFEPALVQIVGSQESGPFPLKECGAGHTESWPSAGCSVVFPSGDSIVCPLRLTHQTANVERAKWEKRRPVRVSGSFSKAHAEPQVKEPWWLGQEPRNHVPCLDIATKPPPSTWLLS